MKSIVMDESYRVKEGTSGNAFRDVWHKSDYWFFTDHYGVEGYNEEVTGELLKASDIPAGDYITGERASINGKPGSCSRSFLRNGESFLSINLLYSSINGRDLTDALRGMKLDYQMNFVVSFVEDETGVDMSDTFGRTFAIDRLILNKNRNFDNMGLVFDGEEFRPAPMFDFGTSFLCWDHHVDLTKPGELESRCDVKFAPFDAGLDDLCEMYPYAVNFDIRRLRLKNDLQGRILRNQMMKYYSLDVPVGHYFRFKRLLLT